MQGMVTNVKLDRGFGFILTADGRSIFFHRDDLAELLPFDQTLVHRRVEFEIQSTRKGPKAVKIKPVQCESGHAPAPRILSAHLG